jgi:PAS domain S-box-containing protein
MRDDLRILVLEDDDNDLELIRRCLKKEIPAVKITPVRTRGSFESALDRRDYDLILSDNTLPGFSGSAALALVRQRGIECPFIFVSGTIGERRAIKDAPHDADARLSKDEIRNLPSVIAAAMARSRENTTGVSAAHTIQNGEERYRELLDSVHAIVWRGDARTFQFTHVSREAEVLLGYPVERWLNEPDFWQHHIHPDDREAAISFCKKATEENRSHEFEYRMMAADGRVVWFHDVVRVVVEDGNPKELFGVMIDVSERRRAEALLEGQKDLLEMVAVGTSLEQVLEGLTRFVEARSEGMLCSILLADDDGQRLRRGAAPSLPEAYNRRVDGLPVGPRAGSCGTAAFRGARVIVADTLSDPLWEEYREMAREFGLRACWSAPVFAMDGKVLGTFAMYYREPRNPSSADLELIDWAARIASIAMERRRAEEELRGANERLQGMSRRLVELQEAERRHVARELHDEIGQLLPALKITLPMGSRSDRADAAGNWKKARGLVDELISRVRELSLDLRPAMLDDLGLLPALFWHFERYSAVTGVRVNFRHSKIEGRRFEPETETAAYRIVQEALTNVARHAGVEEAVVVVSGRLERLHLEIEDRGRGFDASDAGIGGRSSGLAGMRERALLLGGDFTIESAGNSGTRLTATLPLSRSARLERRSTVKKSRPGKARGRSGGNSSERDVA